jgi:hypothetical protein
MMTAMQNESRPKRKLVLEKIRRVAIANERRSWWIVFFLTAMIVAAVAVIYYML